MDKLWRKLILGFFLGFIVFIVLFLFGKKDEILKILSQVNLKLILILSSLSLLNYLIRFFRWNYYLKILKLKVNWWDSFFIFFAGLSLTISPGKVGEVLKTIFLKNKYSYPISKTTSVVFAERFSDLLGVIFLSLGGISLVEYGKSTLLISVFLVALIFFFFLTSFGKSMVLKVFSLFPFLKKHLGKVETLFSSTSDLLQPRVQLLSLVPSIIAWLCEAMELYLIFRFFGLNTGLFLPIFIYSFATLVGGLSMIPGGLGSSEATLVGMMIGFLKLNKSQAVAYSLLIRAFTLWFAVFVGTIFLLVLLKKSFRGEVLEENV